MEPTAILIPSFDLATLIAAWLHAKSLRSHSPRTQDAYRSTLRDYRMLLQAHGLDLDVEPPDDHQADPRTLLAQAFAASSTCGRVVAPATIAQRLAILSSFYAYALKQRRLHHNPIAAVERPPVQNYAQARPLAALDVRARLAQMDRGTLIGRRDYALLLLMLTTGRREAEIAALHWRDVEVGTAQLVVTFHAKGGKVLPDALAGSVARALLDYRRQAYPDGPGADDPVWVSTSRRNPGAGISVQTVADICWRYLGTSKAHATRHTFAVLMEQAGAPLSQIQSRLGHSNAATTSRYLHALSRATNPYADHVAAALGLDG